MNLLISTLNPAIRQWTSIISSGVHATAVEVFAAQERLRALRQQIDQSWQHMDALLLPTTPTIYRLEEIAADPVALNTDLGRTNNFANLADTCAIAIPNQPGRAGLPSGVTAFAPAGRDMQLMQFAQSLHQATQEGIAEEHERRQTVASSATSTELTPQQTDKKLIVLGAHLRGQPLHHRLTSLGATFLSQVQTAPSYRLMCMPGEPAKPALVPAAAGQEKRSFSGECYALSAEAMGILLTETQSPLGFGWIELHNGELVLGYRGHIDQLPANAYDISEFDDWPSFLAAQAHAGDP